MHHPHLKEPELQPPTLGARKPRRIRGKLLALFATVLVGGTLVATAAPASAATTLCSSAAYACTTGGYAGQRTWGYPVDANGHNCTNYAAYKLAQNGAANPGNLGDAHNWDNNAAAKGFAVNGTATVGSIAQWESQHVAYVEVVTDTYIETTDDAWGGGTRRMRYYRNQGGWPDHFIHIKDVPPPNTDPDGDGFHGTADHCPTVWGKRNGCPVKADFSNDGRSEVVAWYRHEGNLTNLDVWNGQANGYTSDPTIPWDGVGWDGSRMIPAGTGNFNGDNHQDLAAFYRHDGQMVDLNIWYGLSNGTFSQVHAWHVPTGWEGARIKPAGAGDFNSDGKADVAAFYRYDNLNVTLYIWYGQANGLTSWPVSVWSASGWDGNKIVPVGVHDADGDGKLDVATFYDHDGDMVDYNVWYGNGAGGFGFARPWHRPMGSGWDAARFVPGGMADINGDGRGDAIVFYNHAGGNLVDMRVWWGTANRVLDGEPGGPWSAGGWDGSRILPAGTGDYNGDGKPDVATFYRHDGQMVDMNIWYGTGGGNMVLVRAWHRPTAWEGGRLIPAMG